MIKPRELGYYCDEEGFQDLQKHDPDDAGIDIRAISDGYIYPHQSKLIHTGLRLAIPNGFEVQVRPRSGLALKYGITVLNSPGTIDSNYTDYVGVILINHGDKTFTYNKGDRIAQLVLKKIEHVKCIPVDLEYIEKRKSRGGGFGHTGDK
jgi:dUTP pyrophosphatase